MICVWKRRPVSDQGRPGVTRRCGLLVLGILLTLAAAGPALAVDAEIDALASVREQVNKMTVEGDLEADDGEGNGPPDWVKAKKAAKAEAKGKAKGKK